MVSLCMCGPDRASERKMGMFHLRREIKEGQAAIAEKNSRG